ncbi:MAG: membrane protein insertion efficiency factor YidD [Bacteroidota bacterium]
MALLLVHMIRGYRMLVSPLLPFNHCRFYPTCSQYAEEALRKHGAVKGLRLALLRILKCHPFHSAGGYDPIP